MTEPHRHRWWWWLHAALVALAAGAIVLGGIWGALALWFQAARATPLRYLAAALWLTLVILLVALALYHRSPWPLAAYALALLLLGAWWHGIRPAADRDWADDVARQLSADIDGDRVTLHDVRNFHWRGRDDYDVRWETRRYDLSRLRSLDAVLSYWGSSAIAHAMLSFGFDDGRHVVFSVEIRRERDEAFSSLGGFFKQFELVLVAADENDIVRVRTNVRGEDDYLFPLDVDRTGMRDLFLAYLDAAAALRRTPRWYNTVTSNCTTLVYRMARRFDPGLPLDARLLLTGYLPEYLYDAGMLDHRRPLAEWKRLGRITERARAVQPDGAFSRAIREGLPASEAADATPTTQQ